MVVKREKNAKPSQSKGAPFFRLCLCLILLFVLSIILCGFCYFFGFISGMQSTAHVDTHTHKHMQTLTNTNTPFSFSFLFILLLL